MKTGGLLFQCAYFHFEMLLHVPNNIEYCTVEPHNEVLGTMKITLLYQGSHYIRVRNQRNIKSWDQQKLPCYKRVLLYPTSL